jgi:hypothetical protein
MIHLRNANTLFVLLLLVACNPIHDPSIASAFDVEQAIPVPSRESIPASEERNLLWGDLHIHTSLSADAFNVGNRSLPEQAYIFAKGGEIEHAIGYGIRIRRPLDFAAVTDHAEDLGVLRAINPDSPLKQRSLRERLLNDGPLRNTIAFIRTMMGYSVKVKDAGDADVTAISSRAWQQVINTAERHYAPGVFTTFIGYEWSSMPENKNLHRNIIFRGSNVPSAPFSSLDSEDPRKLWAWMNKQRTAGNDLLAIPHNGNASGGRMYDEVAFDGSALDAAYATLRNQNEPISEIIQGKGASETHPELSPDDEFANFELYDQLLATKTSKSQPKGSYARLALRTGIIFSHKEGFNPFEFGVIGGSDNHNAATAADENAYFGKLPIMDGSAGLRLGKSIFLPDEYLVGRKWSSAGLTAVWAKANTREEIFSALRRRETYATSGPRILLRFFGGWSFPDDLIIRNDRVSIADQLGVAMGGVLPDRAHQEKTPSFAVWAMKDIESGNLDRIQIVKSWVDDTGTGHEKIYDVALSSGRTADPQTGQVADVGNTVDISTATYQNTIGDTQLSAIWRDPDFNTEEEAVYYARVLEIPTPRWSTYDAVLLGETPPQPATIQERAISSAIWYYPD